MSIRKRRVQPPLLNRRTIRQLVFLFLVVGITYWFYDLVEDFLMPVFWALVLAIVFDPIHAKIRGRSRDRDVLAATLSTLAVTLVVLVPLALVVVAMFREVTSMLQQVDAGEVDPTYVVNLIEERFPRLITYARQYGVEFNDLRLAIVQAYQYVGQWVTNMALKVGQNMLQISISFFLMLYLLWFFFKDGSKLVNLLMRALPLGDKDERMLFERFAVVARATLKGTIIVAIVQGSIGGIAFWALGIDGSLVWGVIMVMLSLLPVGGSAIVWFPAVVIFAANAAWTSAIILFVIGALGIGLIDNFLRPLLIGSDTNMPDYLVLLATLGGIASFGLAGFVIGPVVAALFLSVWELVIREFEESPNPKKKTDKEHRDRIGEVPIYEGERSDPKIMTPEEPLDS